MVQMDRCKLTLDLPKFQPMKEQDSHLLSNQRPALTLDLPKVIIAPPSDNGLVFSCKDTDLKALMSSVCVFVKLILYHDYIQAYTRFQRLPKTT